MKSKKLSIINGLLGTVIIHLVAGIAFYTLKITGFYTSEIQVEVESAEVKDVAELDNLVTKAEKQERAQKIEDAVDAFIANQERRNIAVNVSDKKAAEPDLQQVQREIEDARQQIADVQDNLNRQARPYDDASFDANKETVNLKKKNEKIQGKQAVFKGPTNIYFDLPDRQSRYMYVPVYKCEGLGKVVVNIIVASNGNVESASIDKQNSDTDACLHEAATDAALRSRFSKGGNSQNQRGTITYLFVAQ